MARALSDVYTVYTVYAVCAYTQDVCTCGNHHHRQHTPIKLPTRGSSVIASATTSGEKYLNTVLKPVDQGNT